MLRLIIICEGQTEQAFCKTILYPYFLSKKILIQSPTIKHTKGGIVKWDILKKQIETHLLEENKTFVTTLIDYYGIYGKHSFPNWIDCEKIVDKNDRMTEIEKAMKDDINNSCNHRFIPYLQLHEFEGLLFNEIDIFYSQIPSADLIGEAELIKTFKDYSNPEMINNSRETSPSHRLDRIISGYNKIVHGDILAEEIGLERMRSKSPRFNNWIQSLEQIK
ncbi:DUF4276 family protein [Chryseobacterium hagamense]|uniref:DUF4276 family protein n=1 Tax=Chryseobacterium hagamense TaxID=395935 RepID=A0A511YQK5_9FLAO|nr:DUF4276 family protein [Chryseobacterium hagamense]GEN77476.1 hypothetical protein CHA01nite_32160 [Chryseobacterium hagamense]